MEGDDEIRGLRCEYVLQIDGIKSAYRRFVDALRAGLELKQVYPQRISKYVTQTSNQLPSPGKGLFQLRSVVTCLQSPLPNFSASQPRSIISISMCRVGKRRFRIHIRTLRKTKRCGCIAHSRVLDQVAAIAYELQFGQRWIGLLVAASASNTRCILFMGRPQLKPLSRERGYCRTKSHQVNNADPF